jgi:hypothetical protein
MHIGIVDTIHNHKNMIICHKIGNYVIGKDYDHP